MELGAKSNGKKRRYMKTVSGLFKYVCKILSKGYLELALRLKCYTKSCLKGKQTKTNPYLCKC